MEPAIENPEDITVEPVQETAVRSSGVIFLIIAIVLVTVFFSWLPRFWNHPVVFFLQLILFGWLGGAFQKRLQQQLLSEAKKWLFVVGIAAAIALLFLCAAFWEVQFSGFAIAATASAFLLPFLLSALWQIHAQMVFSASQPWHVSDEILYQQPIIFMNSIPVRFKVKLTEQHGDEYLIAYNASEKMPLGEVFYDMVQKQKKNGLRSFALLNPLQKPYEWTFAASDFFSWKRALDPHATLQENHVGKNGTIWVQRIDEAMPETAAQTDAINFLK